MADGPDWSSSSSDVRCPLCDYNLRGLTEPRCPECGYAFEWGEVLSPPPSLPYLFECQPGRNVRSFVATQVRGWVPRRFWRELRPEVAIRRGRLLLYWLMSAALMLALMSPGLFTAGDAFFTRRATSRAMLSRAWAGDPRLAQVLASAVPPWNTFPFSRSVFRYDDALGGRALAAVGFLAWPWLTFAVLQVFAVSMRRARVRRWHVLRCVLYACDFGLAAGVAVPLLLWCDPLEHPAASAAGAAALLPLAAYVSYRLGTAYHLYLRFHRPFLTAAASQAIALLVTWKAAYWLAGY